MQEALIALEDADAAALLQLRFRSVIVPEEPPEQLIIMIWRHDAAAPWLGPAGWQGMRHPFAAIEFWLEGDDLVLSIERSTVSPIAPGSVVEIQVPDLDLRGAVSWEPLPTPPPPQMTFAVTPERRIVLRPIDAEPGTAPIYLEPGGAFHGLVFAELAHAFSGTLEVGSDGQARITARAPDGAPRLVRFQVTTDGTIELRRPAGPVGETTPLIQPAPGDGTIFGIPRALLRQECKGEFRLDRQTLLAVRDPTDNPPLTSWPRIALGVAAVLLLAGIALGYAFLPDGPAMNEERMAEPLAGDNTPVEPDTATGVDLALEELVARDEPAPPPAPMAELTLPEIEVLEPAAGADQPGLDIPPAPSDPPVPGLPEAAAPVLLPPPVAAPVTGADAATPQARPEPQAAAAPAAGAVPVEEPAVPQLPQQPAVRGGPNTPLDQVLPAGRGSGHKLLAQVAATVRSEGCANLQLPHLRVIESNVEPVRLSAGERFSHRIVYALCPAGPASPPTASIRRVLLDGERVWSVEQVADVLLRPGTWATDEDLLVPPEAAPGRYSIETTLSFGGREWIDRTDLLVE